MSEGSEQRREPARVLLAATGSIGVLFLPQQLIALRSLDIEIRVVLSHTAETMLPAATLRHLCEVYTDDDHGAGHVELARWAEVFIVLPCTAHTLGLLANGLAPNLVTTTVLAHERPLVLFPAMNAQMWNRPAVQRNVDILDGDGHQVIRPRTTAVYEVASKTRRWSTAPPPVEEIVRIIAELLRSRRAGTAPAAEATGDAVAAEAVP